MKEILEHFREKYLNEFTKEQKKTILKKTERLRTKFTTFKKLFEENKLPKVVDELFFRFEDLPLFGKEYWFMHFTSTEPKTKKQLILSFGRTDLESLKLNKKRALMNFEEKGHNCAVMGWYFDRIKKEIINSNTILELKGNEFYLNKNNTEIIFKGKYPAYTLKIIKNRKKICDLKLSAPKKGKKYGFREDLKKMMGIRRVNLYFNFQGILNRKKIRGKTLIQKVIVIGPLTPWNWARLIFKNGSVLSFFIPYISLPKIKYDIQSNLVFYDNKNNRIIKYNDVKINKYGNKNPRWIISANNNNLFVCTRTYSSKYFKLSGRGKLTYKEYLVDVTDFVLDGKRRVTLDDLKGGIGLIEDSTGYLL